MKYITIMVENASRAPAVQKTVDDWIAKYKCQYDVVMGKIGDIAAGSGSIGLPYNVIINPRNMKVYKIIPGDGPSVDSAINALVAENSK